MSQKQNSVKRTTKNTTRLMPQMRPNAIEIDTGAAKISVAPPQDGSDEVASSYKRKNDIYVCRMAVYQTFNHTPGVVGFELGNLELN